MGCTEEVIMMYGLKNMEKKKQIKGWENLEKENPYKLLGKITRCMGNLLLKDQEMGGVVGIKDGILGV